MPNLTVVEHPLVQHKLALLRDKRTPHADFRRTLAEISMLLGYEALAPLKLANRKIETPLKAMTAKAAAQPITFVAILRAGLGMIEGLLALAPEARTGHVGLYRNEETLEPVRYYLRLPPAMDKSFIVVADPMLATGGSAVEALRMLKAEGARNLQLMTLLCARAGIEAVHKAHPDVRIVTAAVDPVLNNRGYIVPGLGDAGDRINGTYVSEEPAVTLAS